MIPCCGNKVPDKRQQLRGVPASNLGGHYGSPHRDAARPKTLSSAWSAEESHGVWRFTTSGLVYFLQLEYFGTPLPSFLHCD